MPTICKHRPIALLVGTVFACLWGLSSQAQIALRLVQLRPTGGLGMTMEKKISAEVLYLPEFDEKTRVRASLGLFNMKPRLEVFPNNAFIYENGVYTQLPSTQTFHKWNMFFFTFGLDYAAVQLMDDRLTLYPGLDIIGGGISTNYETHTPRISDTYFSGGYLLGGLRGRIGADYRINDHFGCFAETCRAYYFVQESGRLDHNDIGLGVRYQF
jgi:hypothetical protein